MATTVTAWLRNAKNAFLRKTVYLRTLLREMGVPVEEPTELLVDNSGAVELSKHQKACHRSRHVKRR